jgi:hypothetical protein
MLTPYLDDAPLLDWQQTVVVRHAGGERSPYRLMFHVKRDGACEL